MRAPIRQDDEVAEVIVALEQLEFEPVARKTLEQGDVGEEEEGVEGGVFRD